VALAGEQAGRDFRLERGRNLLGKGAECDVVLKDALVSERHAVLEIDDDGRAVLQDLGSRHGTRVNDGPVSGRRDVHDGDRIQLGGTELSFRSFAERGAGL
jgi:pSer/pThr/pTyr-binding forkhead associated (FHA) protein